MMPNRASSAVTRRARARSGVISATRLSPPLTPGSSRARRRAMAIAVASSRSFAASISVTSAKARCSRSSPKPARQACQPSVEAAGASARDRISARSASTSSAVPSGSTSLRSIFRCFRSRNRPYWGWPRLAGSAGRPGSGSRPTFSQSSGGIVVSRPGRTTTPSRRPAMAAIRSAAAGIEPVEPATMIGAPSLRPAMRWASAFSMASRWRAGEERMSSSSRAGQKAVAIFRNSTVSCHQEAKSRTSSLTRSAQSRPSVSTASINSPSARASQTASAGLAGATSGVSAWMLRTMAGNWLRQARISRASSSSMTVPLTGGARSSSVGASASKKAPSSSVSPSGRMIGRIAARPPSRSTNSERSTRAARRVGTRIVTLDSDSGSAVS